MLEGKIKYISDKGFGFIEVEGRVDSNGKKSDLFFHAKSTINGTDFLGLQIGDQVSFESVESGQKGDAAVGVEIINPS